MSMGNRRVMASTATEFIRKALVDQQSALGNPTVRAIADKAGIGSSTVQRALTGTGDIQVEAYVAICRALDLSAADLMARAERAAYGRRPPQVVQSGVVAIPSTRRRPPRESSQ